MKARFPAVALVVATTLAAAALAEAPIPPADASREVPALPKELTEPQTPHTAATEVNEDFEAAQSMLNSSPGSSRLSTISPATTGTTLTPPVTITYSGSSDALTINDSGTGRGITSILTNSGNSNSSIFAQSSGAGAGVKGINAGVNGPGGTFLINNSASAEPAVLGATNGTGPAVAGTITKSFSAAPAILGTNTVAANYGIGVQGKGNYIGSYGLSNASGVGYGVFGLATSGYAGTAGLSTTGVGVFGESSSYYGIFGESTSSIGVYGYSANSNGVYALSYKSDGLNAYSTLGRGITAHSVDSIGIYSSSDNSYGIWGQGHNHYGVIGEDSGSGIGVYGFSSTGYAGYFSGKVAATSYLTLSDRNAKTDFAAVNGAQVLERISQMPITSWAFKDDRKLRHIGPMAQDFHAAFGLDGNDDKHIALSDAAGVSLAAIQELNKRLMEKDARIAALEGEVKSMKSMNDTFSARLAKLEEQASASPQIMTAYVPHGR